MASEHDPKDSPADPSGGLDEDAIRVRAFEISERGSAGTPHENWEQAVAELLAERGQAGEAPAHPPSR
jgi:hypothetical protein